MYDAWESQLGSIAKAFRRHRINIAFVSSLQATEHFNRSWVERFAAYWVPEAVTVADYSWKPPDERPIDVLQMGRKWDAYHSQIEEFCRKDRI